MNHIDDLEKAYRRTGRLIDFSRWLEALHQKGECKRVCELVTEEEIDLSHSPAGLRLVVARCHYDIGDLQMAMELARGIVDEQPDHGNAWALLYRIAEALDDASLLQKADEVLDFLGWKKSNLPPSFTRRFPEEEKPSEMSELSEVTEPTEEESSEGSEVPIQQEPVPDEEVSHDVKEETRFSPDEWAQLIRQSELLRDWLLMELPERDWDRLILKAQPITSWLESKREIVENDRGAENIHLMIQREG